LQFRKHSIFSITFNILYRPVNPVILSKNPLGLKSLSNPELSQNAMSLAEQFRQEGREETRLLAEQFRQEGHQEGRQEGRQEGLISSKQQDILEALEIRFQRVPEGLREEIEAVSDPKKLSLLHRAAITCADIESFATEL
jgi:hypothetical protein